LDSMAKKGDWVKIHRVLLEPSQRAPQVPEDTARVPLEMRLNGFLLEETAVPGQEVGIRTLAGREVRGTLVEIQPRYTHTFGQPIPELLEIGIRARALLEEGAEQ